MLTLLLRPICGLCKVTSGSFHCLPPPCLPPIVTACRWAHPGLSFLERAAGSMFSSLSSKNLGPWLYLRMCLADGCAYLCSLSARWAGWLLLCLLHITLWHLPLPACLLEPCLAPHESPMSLKQLLKYLLRK
jgi:hypothetical protein